MIFSVYVNLRTGVEAGAAEDLATTGAWKDGITIRMVERRRGME